MDEKMVKSPKHYTQGRKFEPKDVIRDWGLNFNLGSAVKYLARAGRKDDIIQDLSKAKEYIDFEIAAIKADKSRAEVKKVNSMCKDGAKPECKFNPVFVERDGKGICVGTMEITVPAGTDPEDIVKAVVSKLYGGGEE